MAAGCTRGVLGRGPAFGALAPGPAGAFSPASISGLALWLDAGRGLSQDGLGASPACAHGDPVGLWQDQSGAGNHMAQVTNRPTLAIAQAGGRPAVRFDGVNTILTRAEHTIPTQAPLTVFAVARPGAFALSADKKLCAFQSGSTTGWAAAINRATCAARWNVTGRANLSGGLPAFSLTDFTVVTYLFDAGFDFTAWCNGQKRDFTAGSLDGNPGAAAFNVGGSGFSSEYFTGDLAELLIYAAALTDADRARVEGYLLGKYGIRPAPRLNAPAFLSTPTFDGSGQAVHPDVIARPGGGYWMAMTPFPGGSAAVEDPSILTSEDGLTWRVPGGLVNPIDPHPASGWNSDPDLVLAPDGALWCVYREYLAGSYDKIMARSSADGLAWGAESEILSLEANACLSPALVWDGEQFVLYSIKHLSAPGVIERRTCPTVTGTWSAPLEITCTTPVDLNRWHLDVTRCGGRWWMLLQDEGSPAANRFGLYLACSTDGLSWAFDPRFRLAPGPAGAWDSAQIYRASLVDQGAWLDIWYSARDAADAWHIGRTRYDL